ncbi:hypothetical protein A2210_00980 [Candidatus Woesebacteria bacterium RIFOXYA1_FULL_40_18]|uniref:Uncharacterized protein n=2 Tax=Candidatus Woeseibacteriota TaxID=1752722 RepID=A0A1F8CJY4_9BACT|nr:MAG: hypothetical protein A2210_00980 [Candidatus Woesebacteria bacterium RIFOXYA1_FULL_40_18]OGM81557.1 MAG: hypothetical protein A2361_00755 [Candidatus Woesebacteria bacterium RIFOXYB1_FULL_40_26]
MAINLIPEEIAPKGPAARLSSFLRTVSAIGLTLFILVVFGLTSYYLVNFFSLRTSQTKQDNLKKVISSLESTETSLILLRDRLSKVKEVFAIESADRNVEAVSGVFAQVPPGVSISDFETTLKKIGISVNAQDSLSLGQFMTTLLSADRFGTVNLKAFSFNPASGYAATFELFLK